MITISELYIYPVKSLAGIRCDSAQLSSFGLLNDRRWLIVDNDGQFMSQRTVPKMATIQTRFQDGLLCLSHENEDCWVPSVDEKSQNRQVTVWKDTLMATHVSNDVDEWLSKVLGHTCHLVYMKDQVKRQVDQDFAYRGQYVSFADGYPLLLISQASLDDLNDRLSAPVNMNRFRPNVVVSGTEAFDEDQWTQLKVNDVDLLAVKKCARCIMPSINQKTGRKDQAKMLATLNSYRKENNKVMFGKNLIYQNVNDINGQSFNCGDEVIISR